MGSLGNVFFTFSIRFRNVFDGRSKVPWEEDDGDDMDDSEGGPGENSVFLTDIFTFF